MKITMCLFFLIGFAHFAYTQVSQKNISDTQDLTTYLIERTIPGAGALTQDQLKGISQQSCTVIKEIGPQIEWLHSYVTENKVYCLYRAASETLIHEHAEKGGFPVDKITRLSATIGPETAGDQ